MKILVQCLWIGAGGFLGAIARFLAVVFCNQILGAGFPTGTMVVNVTGSLFLGWFAAYTLGHTQISRETFLAVATGFIGAYTTFSTLMFESSKLASDGETGKATVNIVASLVLGLLAVRIGMWIAAK